jgi:hypothetical protein
LTASRERVFLRLVENVTPRILGKHEAFVVAYRPIVEEYRPPIALTVYTSRSHKGRVVVGELSVQRVGLTPADVAELSHLRFYFSPNGLHDPRQELVPQPAGLWLFRGNRMLLACLEGTPRRPLEEWLGEARKERTDPNFYSTALSYRRAMRSVTLGKRKKKARWWAGAPEKPLQSFHPFRDPALLDPPKDRRPAGVLTHVGGGSAPSRRRTLRTSVEDTEGTGARLDLPERSDLHRLGYKITGTSRAKRWRILSEEAVPRLGLEEVCRTIAGHIRRTRAQRGGEERYAYAIGEWEHDLDRLEERFYDARRSGFVWPMI